MLLFPIQIFQKQLKMLQSKYYLSALLLFCILISSSLFAQTVVRGVVKNNQHQSLEGVKVQLISTERQTITNSLGQFKLEIPQNIQKPELFIQGEGFLLKRYQISKKELKDIIEIEMQPNVIEINPVVITATRTDSRIDRIPTRITVINQTQIEATPGQTPDQSLLLSGVNVNRPFGIFSNKATVTLRGLSGKDQARTLVLVDGVPVNKTDGGTVNWNLFDKDLIDRMEVIKGPVSSLYGGNAMGGVINIITRKPYKPFGMKAWSEFGTYNTWRIGLNLSGRKSLSETNQFYWTLNGFRTKSDGYVSTSDAFKTPYTVANYLKEYGIGGKIGLVLHEKQTIELDILRYDDERGGGETVYEKLGNYTEHDTWQLKTLYRNQLKKGELNVSMFYIQEDYKAQNEYIKDNTYTLYDVTSTRVDMGVLANLNLKISDKTTLVAGLDAKQGSVDASDIYLTSSDVIHNKGKLFSGGAFLQGEFVPFTPKLKFITGIRMDMASYREGQFFVETPSVSSEYMKLYEDVNITEKNWTAFSPKLSVQYTFKPSLRTFVSLAGGFRPPILDDMCRSGKVKGGFKVINPELKPEYLYNIEWGWDYKPNEKLSIQPSVYYSLGEDFMYYITTGDSVNMGFKTSPVFKRVNITEVEIYGFELDTRYTLSKNISFSISYAYTHPKIKTFTPDQKNGNSDLNGKYLTDVSDHSITCAAYWNSKIVNSGLVIRYIGKQWLNDANTLDDKYFMPAQYPDYTVVDLRFQKDIIYNFSASFEIQNLFNKKYYDSKNSVCPGRMIFAKLIYQIK